MKTRQLGNSDLSITPLGLGTWAIGGSGWEFAGGNKTIETSILAIREALDAGVNWIDTAAVYGLGHSEEIVARALEGVRQKPYVFTKCSMVWNDRGEIGHSLKADSVRRECEASLRRLRVDSIDLVPDSLAEPRCGNRRGMDGPGQTKRRGQDPPPRGLELLRRANEEGQAIAPITSLQPPYSLVDRRVETRSCPSPPANRLASLPIRRWRLAC